MRLKGISKQGIERLSKSSDERQAQAWDTYDTVYINVMDLLGQLSNEQALKLAEELVADLKGYIEEGGPETSGPDRVLDELREEGYIS